MRTIAGALGGLLAGAALAVAVLVANARVRGLYLEGPEDALRWQVMAGALGPLAGGWLAYRGGPFARKAAILAALGAVLGAAVGAPVGRLLDPHASGAWAGGVIGCGAGILIGAGAAVLGMRAPAPPASLR